MLWASLHDKEGNRFVHVAVDRHKLPRAIVYCDRLYVQSETSGTDFYEADVYDADRSDVIPF